MSDEKLLFSMEDLGRLAAFLGSDILDGIDEWLALYEENPTALCEHLRAVRRGYQEASESRG